MIVCVRPCSVDWMIITFCSLRMQDCLRRHCVSCQLLDHIWRCCALTVILYSPARVNNVWLVKLALSKCVLTDGTPLSVVPDCVIAGDKNTLRAQWDVSSFTLYYSPTYIWARPPHCVNNLIHLLSMFFDISQKCLERSVFSITIHDRGHKTLFDPLEGVGSTPA